MGKRPIRKKKEKDFWDKLSACGGLITGLGGIITGLSVAVFGYLMSDSIKNGLQERQLQFTNLQHLQKIVQTDPENVLTLKELKRNAIMLSAFGHYAIPLLVNELHTGKALREEAAVTGLKALAFAEPEVVCNTLNRVLKDRSKIFSWYIHQDVASLIGDIGCHSKKIKTTVQVYIEFLEESTPGNSVGSNEDSGGLKQLKKIVRNKPKPDENSVIELRGKLEKTLTIIEENNSLFCKKVISMFSMEYFKRCL